jgi:hypothetical protein
MRRVAERVHFMLIASLMMLKSGYVCVYMFYPLTVSVTSSCAASGTFSPDPGVNRLHSFRVNCDFHLFFPYHKGNNNTFLISFKIHRQRRRICQAMYIHISTKRYKCCLLMLRNTERTDDGTATTKTLWDAMKANVNEMNARRQTKKIVRYICM